MRTLRIIRTIVAYARVLEVWTSTRGADDQPIDPALLPFDLARQGPGGLRLP